MKKLVFQILFVHYFHTFNKKLYLKDQNKILNLLLILIFLNITSRQKNEENYQDISKKNFYYISQQLHAQKDLYWLKNVSINMKLQIFKLMEKS